MKFRILSFIIIGLFAFSLAAEAAKVTYLKKPAQIKRKGTTRFVTLRMGFEVKDGDVIRTGMGARVELTIGPKKAFRIGQATEIEIQGIEGKKKETRTSLNLLLGKIWGSIRKPLSKKLNEKFEVKTPLGVIGVKGTSFGVGYDKESNTSEVSVLKGVVKVGAPEIKERKEVAGPREIAPPEEVSLDSWMVLVGADQKVIIRPGETPTTAPMTEEDKADEWVAFNRERDAELERQGK